MPDDRHTTYYMRLGQKLLKVTLQLQPSWQQYACQNGTLVVRIVTAHYGCVESAKPWFSELHRTLIDDGFMQNPYELCVFVKRALHVAI